MFKDHPWYTAVDTFSEAGCSLSLGPMIRGVQCDPIEALGTALAGARISVSITAAMKLETRFFGNSAATPGHSQEAPAATGLVRD